MYEGYRVIDADGHFYEPRDIWDRYVEPAFYDRRPRVREIFGRSRMDFEVDGVFFHKSKITSATTKRYASQEEKYGDAYRSWWSCESRINDMDKYGWDIQVCLPTAGHVGAQMSRTDVKLGAAVARAYNNWARDYCGESPDRVKFVSVVPGGDAAEVAVEARRSVEELGAVSFIMSTPAVGTGGTPRNSTRSGRSQPSLTRPSHCTATRPRRGSPPPTTGTTAWAAPSRPSTTPLTSPWKT